MKTIIIYYSYTGNTKSIASYVRERLNCDIIGLEPIKPYSSNYDEVVGQGQEEVNNKFTPKIKRLNISLEDYDKIIIASPIWWYSFAPVMRTFLSENNLENKNIFAFFTNGGYGLGHSINDLKSLQPQANVLSYLDIPFEMNKIQISYSVIDKWLNEVKGE